MKEATYFQLQPSEAAILHSASIILAAFIAAGQLEIANEEELGARATRLALRLARTIENAVVSDDEPES
jgi:hypothetical protein